MSDHHWGALLLFVAGVAWLVNIMAVVRQHDRWEEQDRLDHEEWDRLLAMQPLRFPVEWEAPASDLAGDLVYAAMLTSSRFTVSERLIHSVDDTELAYLARAARPFTQWQDDHVRGYTLDLTTGTLEDRKLLGTVLREIRRRQHERKIHPWSDPNHDVVADLKRASDGRWPLLAEDERCPSCGRSVPHNTGERAACPLYPS